MKHAAKYVGDGKHKSLCGKGKLSNEYHLRVDCPECLKIIDSQYEKELKELKNERE